MGRFSVKFYITRSIGLSLSEIALAYLNFYATNRATTLGTWPARHQGHGNLRWSLAHDYDREA